MPVQTRKYFITRHNKETEIQNNSLDGYSKSETLTGEATLEYSKISHTDYKRLKPR